MPCVTEKIQVRRLKGGVRPLGPRFFFFKICFHFLFLIFLDSFCCFFDFLFFYFPRFFFFYLGVFSFSFLVAFLFIFFLYVFQGSLHSGRSQVTSITVGRDTNKSFRVCKVDLATLQVAINFFKTQFCYVLCYSFQNRKKVMYVILLSHTV